MLVYRIPEIANIRALISLADVMTAHLLAADLRRNSQFQIMECSPGTESVCACLAEHSPEILLLGTKSREEVFTALPFLRRIRNESYVTRTIVFFDDSAGDLVAELFRAGAKGIFNQSEYDLERLCRCISCVASGQIWANSQQLNSVLDVFAGTPSLNIVNATGEQMLTRRERDVVKLVAEGSGNREIGEQLNLSVHTVKNYLFNIFEKLGISSRSELLMYVLANSDNTRSGATDVIPMRAENSSSRKYSPSRELQSNRLGPRTPTAIAS